MTIIIKKGSSISSIRKKIGSLIKSAEEKQRKQKLSIIAETFGKVGFLTDKSPIEIQNEMRDEWR